jgi:hypothetical protein
LASNNVSSFTPPEATLPDLKNEDLVYFINLFESGIQSQERESESERERERERERRRGSPTSRIKKVYPVFYFFRL